MTRNITGAADSGVSLNLFRILSRRWHRHAADLSDPYRPERRDMRGPGPKSRQMHDSALNELW